MYEVYPLGCELLFASALDLSFVMFFFYNSFFWPFSQLPSSFILLNVMEI